MRNFIVIGLLLASCTSKTQKTTTVADNGVAKQLDSLFTALHMQGDLNGNVLIASGDTIVYQKSFGIADHATGNKLNDSSVFELASVSKQFTAMGIVLLKEKGKLKYEDSLRYFFPELPYENITVKHLLQHTSGLPDYMEPVMKKMKDSSIGTNEDVIAILAEKKLKVVFKPGEKWEYSNTGYALLASIIEKVSGKSFGDFLKENIFNPLGMTHTQVYRRRFEKRTVDNYALGYVQDEKTQQYVLADSTDWGGQMVYKLDGIVGDGTVNSSTIDLLKWSLALDKHQLVSKAVQDEIFTPGTLNNGKAHTYGFGWMTGEKKICGRIVNHSGGWPGYGTYIEKHLDGNKTIIILSNHDQPRIPFAKLINILYGTKEEEKKELKLEESVLKQYEGQYELDPAFIITITVEKGRIYEQATGQERVEIFSQQEDLFFLKVVDAQIQFVRSDTGAITGIVLLQDGNETPGKKIK